METLKYISRNSEAIAFQGSVGGFNCDAIIFWRTTRIEITIYLPKPGYFNFFVFNLTLPIAFVFLTGLIFFLVAFSDCKWSGEWNSVRSTYSLGFLSSALSTYIGQAQRRYINIIWRISYSATPEFFFQVEKQNKQRDSTAGAVIKST